MAQKTRMALGYVSQSKDGNFEGTLALGLKSRISIVANDNKTADKQPDFRVFTNDGAEIGGGWNRVGKTSGIPLIVLPPSRPTYNGGVERGNRTFKEEFYYRTDLLADSIGAMRFELRKAVEKYNTYRPHYALAGLTPMAYIKNTQNGG